MPEKIRQELRLADLQRRIGNLERVLGNSGKYKSLIFYKPINRTKCYK